MTNQLETLLQQYIDHWVLTRESLAVKQLCPNDPQQQAGLEALIASFHSLDSDLDAETQPGSEAALVLPAGYQMIEEIGRGSFGRVFKARDLQLQRVVAVKLVDQLTSHQSEGILREARFLAVLDDSAFPAVYAVDAQCGAIVTEFVEGFDLLTSTSSLDFPHLARIMIALARALDRAHQKGILHRDIKPGNIMLDSRLQPRMLDFGLAQFLGEPRHGWGTPAFAAPEQFEEQALIDARTDIYALGAVFYEMLLGAPPFEATAKQELIQAIRNQVPALPISLRPELPPGLQAILLKCLEKDARDRYPTARYLVQDLQRFLDGRQVLARPGAYATSLRQKATTHLEEIRSWRQTGLIYPHEERFLAASYRKLSQPLEDWVPAVRLLSNDGVVLYLGLLVLWFGTACLFYAYHFGETPFSPLVPLLMLGGCSLAAGGAATRLQRAQTVSVAYDLACLLVLPLFLLTCWQVLDWFSIRQGPDLRLLETFSNAQLQVTSILVFVRAAQRARRTQTIALGSAAVLCGCFMFLAILLNQGWFKWLMEGEYHRLALHLVPLLFTLVLVGFEQEKAARNYLAAPCYTAAGLILILVLELLAQNGKVMATLGLATLPNQLMDEDAALRLDTIVAMAMNGLVIYVVARLLAWAPSNLLRRQSSWLFFLSPFLVLEPFAYLVSFEDYRALYRWLYLFAALGILFASSNLQRKSFFYAGLANILIALAYITHHEHWIEEGAWYHTLILLGLALLLLGYRLYRLRSSDAPLADP